VTAVTPALMHRTAKYFITFTPNALRWLWQPSLPN